MTYNRVFTCIFWAKSFVVSHKIANFAPNYSYLRMVRRLLIFVLSVMCLSLAPMTVSAAPAYMAGVMEMYAEQEADVVYANGALLVTGAEGCTLEVVSLTGKKVLSVEISSPAQKIELNIPKGCYIVKVGKVVRKVSVR